MPLHLRPLSVAALLVGGAAGLIYLGPDTGSRRVSDRNAPLAAECVIDEEFPTDEELERRRQILLQRAAAKDRVVRKLLAGRLTLLQAAAQFRDVEKAHPVTWGPRTAAAGPADGEPLCRAVIALANAWMEEHVPAAAADTTARLEAELEQHRRPDGVVRLPD